MTGAVQTCEPHFVTRARERGVSAPWDAHAELWRAVAAALADPLGWSQFVEMVMDLGGGKCIWRFRTTDGIFYAVMHGAVPVTCLTQPMLAGYKRRAKRGRHDRRCGSKFFAVPGVAASGRRRAGGGVLPVPPRVATVLSACIHGWAGESGGSSGPECWGPGLFPVCAFSIRLPRCASHRGPDRSGSTAGQRTARRGAGRGPHHLPRHGRVQRRVPAGGF